MAPDSPTALDEPDAAPMLEPRPVRARRTWMQRTIIGAGILAVIAVLAGILAVGYGMFRFNQINKEKLNLSKVGAGGAQNYLVVGSDSRASIDEDDPNADGFIGGKEATGGQRSDTIIIMRVDPKAHTMNLLSLPRDLWVTVAGTGEEQRINTAYSLSDGRQRLIDTIQQNFGIPINHYIEIDFKGFQGVVDALGGVPMYFDEPMRDDNSGLNIKEAGCVTLDGEQALAFTRSRHLEYKDPKTGKWKTDPTGDLGRINRQQIFLRKVIDASASKATSLDLGGTNDLLDAGVQNLTVDSAFGLDTMLALGREFKSFSGEQMVSHTLPVTPFRTNGGADVLRLDQAAAAPIFELFKGEDATPKVKPSEVTLSVRNSGAANGAAGKSQAALHTLGFVVTGTDTGQTTVTRTQVRYGTGAQDQATLVARFVKGGAEVTEDETMAAGEVRLVLGKDFTAIVDENGTTVTGGAPPSTATGKTTTTTASTTITSEIGEGPGVPPAGVTCG